MVARRWGKNPDKWLPEIFVGTTDTGEEAWARDNSLNRIKIFPSDQRSPGRELKDVKITWIANFQSASNPTLDNDDQVTIKHYILTLLKAQLGNVNTTPSQKQPKSNAVSAEKVAPKEKKPALKRKGGKRPRKRRKVQDDTKDDDPEEDHDIVASYMESDKVPDKKTAARIGRAKGRIALTGTPIPAEVIIEMKEMALKAHISPFFAWAYGRFVRTLPSLPHPKRPIPSSYDPSPPQESPTDAAVEPEGPEEEEGLDPAVLEACSEIRRLRESMIPLEQWEALLAGTLPELTSKEEEAFDDNALGG